MRKLSSYFIRESKFLRNVDTNLQEWLTCFIFNNHTNDFDKLYNEIIQYFDYVNNPSWKKSYIAQMEGLKKYLGNPNEYRAIPLSSTKDFESHFNDNPGLITQQELNIAKSYTDAISRYIKYCNDNKLTRIPIRSRTNIDKSDILIYKIGSNIKFPSSEKLIDYLGSLIDNKIFFPVSLKKVSSRIANINKINDDASSKIISTKTEYRTKNDIVNTLIFHATSDSGNIYKLTCRSFGNIAAIDVYKNNSIAMGKLQKDIWMDFLKKYTSNYPNPIKSFVNDYSMYNIIRNGSSKDNDKAMDARIRRSTIMNNIISKYGDYLSDMFNNEYPMGSTGNGEAISLAFAFALKNINTKDLNDIINMFINNAIGANGIPGIIVH